MLEFILAGQDHTDTSCLELRTTSTTEDLQDIQDADIDKFTCLGAVKLRAFDDDSSSRQVDTPG